MDNLNIFPVQRQSGSHGPGNLRHLIRFLTTLSILGAVILPLNICVADSSSPKPPSSNQPPPAPNLPQLAGPGDAGRGEKLYNCGKAPCNNGPSDTAGCFRCHGDGFSTDPAAPNGIMFAVSKSMLYSLANCNELMNAEEYPCAEQSSWFNGFTEQDFRDLAAFISSKDKNKYTVSGYAGPYTSIYVTSDYLPGAAVSFPNGHYSITLAPGEYQITPERKAYSFSPKSRDLHLDFYVCYTSGLPASAPHSHALGNVNFTQSAMRYQPVNPDALRKKTR